MLPWGFTEGVVGRKEGFKENSSWNNPKESLFLNVTSEMIFWLYNRHLWAQGKSLPKVPVLLLWVSRRNLPFSTWGCDLASCLMDGSLWWKASLPSSQLRPWLVPALILERPTTVSRYRLPVISDCFIVSFQIYCTMSKAQHTSSTSFFHLSEYPIQFFNFTRRFPWSFFSTLFLKSMKTPKSQAKQKD